MISKYGDKGIKKDECLEFKHCFDSGKTNEAQGKLKWKADYKRTENHRQPLPT